MAKFTCMAENGHYSMCLSFSFGAILIVWLFIKFVEVNNVLPTDDFVTVHKGALQVVSDIFEQMWEIIKHQ